MRKLALVAASTPVVLFALSGCGGGSDNGSSDDYCDLLKKSQDSFGALAFDKVNEEDFATSQETFGKLEDAASGSIADDWHTLGAALDDLRTAVESAGLSMSDIPNLITGNAPAGLDPTQAQELVGKLQQIGQDEDLSAAANEIADDAKQTCNITLQ